jgi:Domain of unknown function (DUF4340)
VLLVALATGLVLVIEGPRRISGPESVHGPRVLHLRAAGVRAIEVEAGTRRLSATRSPGGWVLDGRPAPAPAAEALDALAETLAGVRALDAFRPGDRQALGLDPARAMLTVRTRRGDQRLRLGETNASGGALYVERDGHPRAFLVGTGLLSSLDRVFYQRDLAASPEQPETGAAAPAAP